MIKSMTGFGRGALEQNGLKIDVELSAVNRKQFDFAVSMPQDAAQLETPCRDLVREYVARGRVSCQIRLTRVSDTGDATAAYDADAFRQRVLEIEKLSEALDMPNNLTFADLIKIYRDPDSLKRKLSPDDVWEILKPALTNALEALTKMRETEGFALKDDLTKRIDALETWRTEIKTFAPAVAESYRVALAKRIADLGIALACDDASLAREVALFADKCDISEEITRLETHHKHFNEILERGEPCGRQLDFLCQEINREINTIGSKANAADISRIVINFKSALEAIREQVQNLE